MVYIKTSKGRAEVESRAAGLNSRQRSTLIMLDGQKRLDAIPALPPQPELEAIIAALLEMELIAPQAPISTSQAHAVTPAHAKAAPTTALAPVDTARMLRIKSMMVESAEAYLGLMAADLVRRIRLAGDEAQLQSVLGHWHMAMCESKYGRAVAGEQLAQIKARFAHEPSSQASAAMN
ncbi:hypothetical protein HSX11_26250 [Oxalobacteraceae bacterium]|nr:hypothetical protein [Oxalobacteraceae bacterium]